MAYTCIIVEVSDEIATITLNRPEAMNAINSTLLTELAQALEEADASEKVRCVVLTGSEKAFAAGADVAEMANLNFVDVYRSSLYADDMARIGRIRKPIIAAVAGYALGGGCELAMACDFIIAADTAKFGQPEVNLGVMAGMGGSQRLTKAVGKPKAMDMHLTGRFMAAEEAERAGLVSRVVLARNLLAEARGIAEKIAQKGQLAVIAIKDAVNRSQETGLSDGLAYEQRLFQGLFATEDRREGMNAFREKREPQYRDR